MSDPDRETVQSISPALAAAKYFVEPSPELAFEFGAASHAGLRRPENQDHYIVLRRIRNQQLLLTNVPTEQLTYLTDETFGMAVADGMGGEGCGELASRLAIREAWDLAGRATSWVMKLRDLNSSELSERVEGFVYMMQEAFVHEHQSNPCFSNSGTTWTSAYLVGTFAVIAQIGDSPSFLWRDGIFQRITTDHTIEQEFITAGVAPEIAGKYSHMLTRCLRHDAVGIGPTSITCGCIRETNCCFVQTVSPTWSTKTRSPTASTNHRRPKPPATHSYRWHSKRAEKTTSLRCSPGLGQNRICFTRRRLFWSQVSRLSDRIEWVFR